MTASIERQRDNFRQIARDQSGYIITLQGIVRRYIAQHPSFRAKPTGAPGSSVRALQDTEVALEDEAKAALASDPISKPLPSAAENQTLADALAALDNALDYAAKADQRIEAMTTIMETTVDQVTDARNANHTLGAFKLGARVAEMREQIAITRRN